MPANQKLIPAGYTFVGVQQLISREGAALFRQLKTDADNRCPDFFNMYIYNDFHAYGTLDLVETALNKLKSLLQKKNLQGAYQQLEGLAAFFVDEAAWMQCDDGDRVTCVDKAFGAVAIALFKALKKEGKLGPDHLPNLETVLKNIYRNSTFIEGPKNCLPYGRVCKGIARQLFSGKTEEERTLEFARVQEWINDELGDDPGCLITSLSLEDWEEDSSDEDEPEENDEDDGKGKPKGLTAKEFIQLQLDFLVKKSKKKTGDDAGAPWFMRGEYLAENARHPDLSLTPVWKEYRDMVREDPLLPFRGPPEWDLTTWTEADKRPFSF